MKIKIKSYNKCYEVQTHRDILELQELSGIKNSFFVTDRRVYELYYDKLFRDICKDRLFLIDASEEHKVIDTALSVCEQMTKLSAKRNAVLVSFGGGIVQDITGFAAGILYRGVHWYFVPTTLLAACDSCIGAKTSLNYGQYKNLLGTFYAPDRIDICPQFFHTLSDRDFYSGLGEIAKFQVMAGEAGVERLERDIDRLILRDDDMTAAYLYQSLEFKKTFIEEDEFDRGVRMQLNFAHTFAHALETASHYEIPHGTAVAMGAIAADRISVIRGYLSGTLAKRMEALLCRMIPLDIPNLAGQTDMLLDAMKKDKKRTGSALTTVLLKEESNKRASLQVTPDTAEEEAEQALAGMFRVLGERRA